MKRVVLLLSAATLAAIPITSGQAGEACPRAPQRAKQECYNPMDKMQPGVSGGSFLSQGAFAPSQAQAAPVANAVTNPQPAVANPVSQSAPAPSSAQLAPAPARAASVAPAANSVTTVRASNASSVAPNAMTRSQAGTGAVAMQAFNTGMTARSMPMTSSASSMQKNMRMIAPNPGADVSTGLPKERRPR